MAGNSARSSQDRRRKRVNGEGTIFQRSDNGLWAGSAYVYTTAGVRKRRWVYGRSAEEVMTKLDRLRGNSASGVPVPDKAMTLSEYLDRWLAEVAETKRATTHRGYESVVRLHISPVLGRKRLDRLGASDVRELIAVTRAKCLCCTTASTATAHRRGSAVAQAGAASGIPRSDRFSSSTPCYGTP